MKRYFILLFIMMISLNIALAVENIDILRENVFVDYYEKQDKKSFDEMVFNFNKLVNVEINGEAKDVLNVEQSYYSWSKSSNEIIIAISLKANKGSSIELYGMDNIYRYNEGEKRRTNNLEIAYFKNKKYQIIDIESNRLSPQYSLMFLGIVNNKLELFIVDSVVSLPLDEYDYFIKSTGNIAQEVCYYIRICLNRLNDGYLAKQLNRDLKIAMLKEPQKSNDSYIEYRLGDIGEDVLYIQNALSQLNYYNGDLNGVYNKETELCIGNYQKHKSLKPTCTADDITQQKLYADYDVLNNEKHISGSQAVELIKNEDKEGNISLKLPFELFEYKNKSFLKPILGCLEFSINIKKAQD